MKAATVTKAELYCPEKSSYSIEFLINPSELSVQRRVDWIPNKTGGGGDAWGGEMGFAGGQPDELEFTVLLDESLPEDALPLDPLSFEVSLARALLGLGGVDTNDNSIVDALKDIHRLTMPLEIMGSDGFEFRPPVVVFKWGKDFRFVGTLEFVDSEIKLVDAKGRAKRAEVKMQMKGRSFTDLESVDDFFSNKNKAPKSSMERWGSDWGGFGWGLDLDLALAGALAAGAAGVSLLDIATMTERGGDPRNPFLYREREDRGIWVWSEDGWTFAEDEDETATEDDGSGYERTAFARAQARLDGRLDKDNLRKNNAVTYQDLTDDPRSEGVTLDEAAAGGNYSGEKNERIEDEETTGDASADEATEQEEEDEKSGYEAKVFTGEEEHIEWIGELPKGDDTDEGSDDSDEEDG